MFCRNCGKEVPEQAVMCVACGVPPNRGNSFCRNCGAQTDSQAAVCLKCGAALLAPSIHYASKPSKVTAIAIMVLISGILNCSAGIIWFFTCFGIPIGAYSILVGIFEIIYAAKLLPEPIKTSQPAKYVAIMEIVNIVSCSVSSLVIGILCLVFYCDDEVAAYFERQGAPMQ